MAILKSKDISKMAANEIKEKIKELKNELIRERVKLTKGGKTKIRELKKTIARLLTFNKMNKTKLNKHAINL